ncbi:MAG TPA: DUF4382 domain-containing protein [Steroidobacteraceae bacterium]|nr:DUF4382 domain-containing protein [Steroidobacteraceae bacterium]
MLFSAFLSRARAGLLLIFALVLGGCGGGGMDSTGTTTPPSQACSSGSDCGPLFVSITDADGDFLSYSVDVLSLTLKKANGALVETLPVSTRVDFAQLVDLTEFVTAATIPNGTYVQGTMRLDYTNADVSVEVNGEPRAATIVGANGQPLGVVNVDIMLDNRNHVVIAPGRPALLQLDFDLAASHTVDTTTTPVTAVAEPFIVASLEPVDQKDLRVRGPLVSVNSAGNSYLIDMRPFNLRDARLGQFTVHITGSTDFEVDGQTFTGAAGLDALAQTGVGTATVAFGTLDVPNRTFTAQRVHAGTSVAGSQFDVLAGNVTARNGNTLTVRGGTMIRRAGSVTFIRDDITLLVGSETAVIRDGEMGNALGAEAISIGQRIRAFGTATESNGEVTLDAQQGRVRLELTHLLGAVKSTSPGNLALDLDSIDGRRVSIFDFTGTGSAPDTNADPTNYEIVTGNLDLSRLMNDSPARVFGFVTPFGAAPPDFAGRTLVDFNDVRALLGIGWGLSGTTTPFLSIDAQAIVIDNANAGIGLRHFIAIGPRLIDIETLPVAPTIKPTTGNGLYAIGQPRRVEVFSDFGEFTARLSEKLAAGGKALGMNAGGKFDAASSTLTANHVNVILTATN